MTRKELERENETLKHLLGQNLFWARRYAHGRSTYCPSMVRDDIIAARKMGVVVKNDVVIEPPDDEEIKGMTFRRDFLDDTNHEGEA